MKKITILLLLTLVAASASALPFVTTPSPSTYPIHWYKLKINGQYLIAWPTYDSDVDVVSTCEDSDEYLWCFVELASGKIAVYNKRTEAYLSDGYYLSGTVGQDISLVEESSGNRFYIYSMSGSQRMYLCYDSENGLHTSSKSNASTFTVEGEIIEDRELTAAPEIFVEPYTDYYTVSAAGNGEVKLYIDNVRVSNPYSYSRPRYYYTAITLKATAKEEGKLENSTTMVYILAPKGKPEAVWGDVNFDGSVNTGDVSELYRAVLAGATDLICDINGDGSVNTGDVSAIYEIILGN